MQPEQKARIIENFKDLEQVSSEYMQRYAASILKDSVHALKWGTEAYHHACQQALAKSIISYVEGGVELDVLIAGITDRVMHRGEYPAQSTSPTSNLVEQYEARVAVQALQYLKRFNKG